MGMRIVNFYSFKGGVGRSLCLLNVAYQLSHGWGKKIGLIDLDLEACGLYHILKCDVNPERHLLTYLFPPKHRDVAELEKYIIDITFGENEQPKVFLLPTMDNAVLLDQVLEEHQWKAASAFLKRDLIWQFASLYELDYLFIDSRSGLSSHSMFALGLANLEILVCRLDRQNRYGIKNIITACKDGEKDYRVVVSGCPKTARAKHLSIFEREVETSVAYVLPYEPTLYYDEFIISKEKPNHPLSKEYLAIASAIQKDFQ